MNDLIEVTKEPTFLEKLGFTGREQDSTDTVRWVWYERTIDSYKSQVRFVIQVEFEMFITDDPVASYTDNVSYSFNRIYIKVIDRHMEKSDNQAYDEETENPREVGHFRVNIQKVSELRSICKMLSLKD